MPIFKMPNCLPQSAPGNTEIHFGHKCEVRTDGIYVELIDQETIANFKASGRIGEAVANSKPEKQLEIKEPIEVAEEKQTITDVVENGSGKRAGRPAKDK